MQELQISEWCEAPEIAGPGFINVKLRPSFVESRLKAMIQDKERLAVPRCASLLPLNSLSLSLSLL